ncbi:MAG: sulfotransferase [Rubellimicrobium sp.]|nr:sulfotransferase [Rubellimicrobium sp.]
MSEPVLLYGVGATKAGTSWFYRMLKDHPECAVPEVKEAHYWDTFDPAARAQQVDSFRRQITALRAAAARERVAPGRAWRAANLERYADDLAALVAILEGERTGDRLYRDWLMSGAAGKRLVADITPAYGLLPPETLRRMDGVGPRALFVYLVRDPVARLWSHVRMLAQRQLAAGGDLARQAGRIMRRILDRGEPQHVLVRGDYPAAHARLSGAVAADRLRVEYCERLYTEAGQRDMAQFLGIGYHPADATRRVHEGPGITLPADLAARAARMLAGHYAWAARTLGPLPQAWQDNLALASRHGA